MRLTELPADACAGNVLSCDPDLKPALFRNRIPFFQGMASEIVVDAKKSLPSGIFISSRSGIKYAFPEFAKHNEGRNPA
jgi:hypothetical protein